MAGAVYRLRLFFDPGSGTCLWSANDAARERFGYPVEIDNLPLPENTRRRLLYLCYWYDTSIGWDYPPASSPWDAEEKARFDRKAQRLLARVRSELGPSYEVVDESGTGGTD